MKINDQSMLANLSMVISIAKNKFNFEISCYSLYNLQSLQHLSAWFVFKKHRTCHRMINKYSICRSSFHLTLTEINYRIEIYTHFCLATATHNFKWYFFVTQFNKNICQSSKFAVSFSCQFSYLRSKQKSHKRLQIWSAPDGLNRRRHIDHGANTAVLTESPQN